MLEICWGASCLAGLGWPQIPEPLGCSSPGDLWPRQSLHVLLLRLNCRGVVTAAGRDLWETLELLFPLCHGFGITDLEWCRWMGSQKRPFDSTLSFLFHLFSRAESSWVAHIAS